MGMRGIGAVAAAVLGAGLVWGGVCRAGVTTSFLADGNSFDGTPAVNTAGSAANAISSTFTVGLTLAAGSTNRFGQTFTTTSAFTLDKIEMYVSGGQANNLGLHLYANVAGGTDTDTFVNPNNPTPTDLLGGGAGLSFNMNDPQGFLVLDLTGADEVPLAANTLYYVELSGGDASVFTRRAGSGSLYTGGNAYSGTDPTTFRGPPSAPGNRDSAMAVYAAAVVPEPVSAGVLAVAAVGMMARRRRHA